jgi:hypothetical protein
VQVVQHGSSVRIRHMVRTERRAMRAVVVRLVRGATTSDYCSTIYNYCPLADCTTTGGEHRLVLGRC